jgi:putative ABC transport system permease protein
LVSPEYFGTLHIPLINGRLWDISETERGATLALVNKTFAHRYFPDESPIGHSIRITLLVSKPPALLGSQDSNSWLQVIGIVGDAINDGLDKPVKSAVFVPYTLPMPSFTQILVRTRGQPLAMFHSIRQRVAAINPDQQVHDRIGDLETWITRESVLARGPIDCVPFRSVLYPRPLSRCVRFVQCPGSRTAGDVR